MTVASPRGGPAPVDPRGYASKADIAEAHDALETLFETVHLAQIGAVRLRRDLLSRRGRLDVRPCERRSGNGGPAREAPDSPPEMMVIVVETVDHAAAEAFIASEPHNANGGFTSVRVRPWSQVLPEPTPGSLQATYDGLVGTET